MISTHTRLARHLGVLALSAGLAACGATNCGGCLVPLDQPFPEDAKFNGAAQVRMTPSGINFLETELPGIISSLASINCDPGDPANIPCPAGMSCVDGDHCEAAGQRQAVLGFRIPFDETIDPAWCLSRFAVCENASSDQCLVYVDIQGVSLSPTSPDLIKTDLDTEIQSTWIPTVLERSHWYCPMPAPDCDIKITKKNRKLAVDTRMRTDNPLQRLQFDVGDPSLSLEASDIEIGGGFTCNVIDFVMPLLFPLLRGQLTAALNDTVKNSVRDMTTESCAAPATCTEAAATYCDSDELCRFSATDGYVPTLMGVEGGMDLASLLGDFVGQAGAPIGLSVAAGGYAEVLDRGIEIGLRGGTDVEPADCVPPFVEVFPEPPRLIFGDSVVDPGSSADTPFMMGMALSDRMLDEIMRSTVASGALCQRIDSGLSSYVNTGALGLLASSLGQITRGGAKPALIQILPRAPLSADIGLGTTSVDPNDPGRTILDQPLLTLRARDLDLDMYGLIDERYVRFMTMRVDLRIGIGLSDDGQGNLMVLLSGPEDWLQNVEVLNTELLTNDPADIEAAVPTLIGTMLGQFAPDLGQSIALPDMAGFTLRDLIIRGSEPLTNGGTPRVDDLGNTIFGFLGIYANLAFDAAAAGGPLGYTVDTRAEIARLQIPALEHFNVAGGLQLPELWLQLHANGHTEDEVEYSYRVDGGFWRPFHANSQVHVTDPALMLMGRHRVEVRGRLVGAPATLDRSPAEVEVLIDPLAPEVEVELDRASRLLTVVAHDAVSRDHDLRVRVRQDQGDWVEQRGLAPIELATLPSASHRLEVEVIDEAGNIARTSLGQRPVHAGPAEARAADLRGSVATESPSPVAQTGCSCRAVKASAPFVLSMLSLLALLGVRRRRR